MPPAVRHKLEQAALLGWLLACAGCDTDFSPEGYEQPIEAGAPPSPSDDAGSRDGDTPELPVSDAETPSLPKFTTCRAHWLCDQADPSCAPVCLASSMEIDGCLPGEECKAYGFSPVPCAMCLQPPIK
jgi:hypothetical protein